MSKGYIREGAQLVEDEAGIAELQVWDLEAVGSGQDFLWNARAHGAPPRLGDRHPRDPSLIVATRTITALGAAHARVQLQYREPSISASVAVGTVTDVRYDGTVITEQRKTDISGAALISGVSAYTVGVQVPAPIVEVDRIERTLPGFDYLSQLMGHVNTAPFSGYPARTLLLYAPRSRALATGGPYVVTHVIAINLANWDTRLEAIEIESVAAASGASAFGFTGQTNTVIKSVRNVANDYPMHPGADFSRLGFSI